MPISFWRSSDATEQLKRLDRPGFALEFLRRNTGYQTDYRQTLGRITRGQADPADARTDLARRWGLRFRA